MNLPEPANFQLTFGSYKGLTLKQIYQCDRPYILWLRDETNGPAQVAAREFIRGENLRIIEEGKKNANARSRP